jgi:RND family efflux transporter MFP subunit
MSEIETIPAPRTDGAAGPHGNGSQPLDHAPVDHDAIPTDLPKVGNGLMIAVVIVFVLLLAGLFVLGYVPHRERIAEADRIAADQNSKPLVQVVQPTRETKGIERVFPADARALQETSIYPRASGYLKRLLVDIGDRVKQGQLLAEIDSPEVDSQLNEARAQLEQVKTQVVKTQADFELAQSTLNRYEEAAKTSNGAVTQQDLDEKRATFNQAKAAVASSTANVTASEAAVQRLSDLQSFQKVTAPFAGVISARNYDIGALLSPSSTAPGSELFRLTQSDTLRVFINVPQSYASAVKLGQPATFTVSSLPGRKFTGTVSRNTGALDPATRTLRMQVDIPNKDYTLWAGMYGQVSLNIVPEQPPLIVPTSAMVFRSDGTVVAVVEDGKVKMTKVSVGRDMGTTMEIISGLNGTEQVVSNPGERLADGVEVKIVEPKTPDGASPAKPTQTAATR